MTLDKAFKSFILVTLFGLCVFLVLYSRKSPFRLRQQTRVLETHIQKTAVFKGEVDPARQSRLNLGTEKLPDFKLVVTDRGGPTLYIYFKVYVGYPQILDIDRPDFRDELVDSIPVMREMVYRVFGSATGEELCSKEIDPLLRIILNKLNDQLRFAAINEVIVEDYICTPHRKMPHNYGKGLVPNQLKGLEGQA